MKMKKGKFGSEPPVQDVVEADTWSRPNMSLVQDVRYRPPAFPLEVFHEDWQEWIVAMAESKCCPVDFIAVSLLIAIAGVIGNARHGRAWGEFEQPTILWAMIVGEPSSNKTPAVSVIASVLFLIEQEMALAHKETLDKYRQEKSLAEAHQRDWERTLQDKISSGVKTEGMQPPTKTKLPDKPHRPRLVTADATIEEEANILSYNVRGIMKLRDEISGWIKQLELPVSPARAFYMQAYDGVPYTVDRVKYDDPIIIPSLSISIIGGIQPDKLDRLVLQGDNDGFAARFLYSWPASVPFKRPNKLTNKQVLKKALEKLRGIPMHEGENKIPQPIIIPFSEKADDYFADWRANQPEREEGAPSLLKAQVGKMSGMAIRIAVVLMYLEWSLDTKPEPTVIKLDYVKKATLLLDQYFLPMGWRTLSEAGLPQEQQDARLVAHYILRKQSTTINVKQFVRMKGSPLRDRHRLQKAMEFLEESHWVRFTGGRDADNKGRERKEYTVNPKLFNK